MNVARGTYDVLSACDARGGEAAGLRGNVRKSTDTRHVSKTTAYSMYNYVFVSVTPCAWVKESDRDVCAVYLEGHYNQLANLMGRGSAQMRRRIVGPSLWRCILGGE